MQDMKKSAVVFVENRESLLHLCSYLQESDWQILSFGDTAEYLKTNEIPYKAERNLDYLSSSVSDTSSFMQKILLTSHSEYSRNADTDNNVRLLCVNCTPRLMHKKNNSDNLNNEKYASFIVSLIRSGIINYKNVLILTDPVDYNEAVIQMRTDSVSMEFREYLMGKALNLVSAYDAAVSFSILRSSPYADPFLNYLMIPYKKKRVLQHGANEQQSSALYSLCGEEGTVNGVKLLQGNVPTYAVVSDSTYAWELVGNLYMNLKTQMAVESENRDGYKFNTQIMPLTGTVFCIIVKHKLIVGAGIATNSVDSFRKALNYDSTVINNASIACSSAVDADLAKEIIKYKFTSVIAPGFTEEARNIFSEHQVIRLLQTNGFEKKHYDAENMNGGILVQSVDDIMFEKLFICTTKRPSQEEMNQLAFGTIMVMNSHSYAAVVIKDNGITGISSSFGSRLKTLQNVTYEAKQTMKKHLDENNGDEKIGDVLVCDSAIPLCDSVKELIDGGVKAIMQTGGLQEDKELIDYCDEKGVSMIFTGRTHYHY